MEKQKNGSGIVLKKILKDRKMTQAKLAEKIGVEQGTVSKIISQRTIAKNTTIEAIIDKLSLTEEEKFELWKWWTLDKAEKKVKEYFLKIEEENEKFKKILRDIKEI